MSQQVATCATSGKKKKVSPVQQQEDQLKSKRAKRLGGWLAKVRLISAGRERAMRLEGLGF